MIPKTEVDNLFDLSPDYLSEMLVFAQPIAKAIERSFKCNRCGISVIGLEIPHAHMHLIPINSMSDCNFANAKLQLNKEEFQTIAASISKAF